MSEPYTFIADLAAQVPEVPPDSILSRTLYEADDLKVVLFAFAAGQSLSEHTAARPAVLHFVSGQAELVLGEDKLSAGPGTWVHMPAHLAHSIHAQTAVVLLLLLL